MCVCDATNKLTLVVVMVNSLLLPKMRQRFAENDTCFDTLVPMATNLGMFRTQSQQMFKPRHTTLKVLEKEKEGNKYS